MPSPPKKISILLADDHPIVRQGVRLLLEQEPDIRVVGEAGDGREALEKVRELSPDIVVMDISMPDLNGIEATRHITRTCPATRVVALSVHSSGQFIKDMFKAGASGYLLKESAPEELTAAIHAVTRGEVFLSTAIAGKVVSGYVDGDGQDRDVGLSGEMDGPDTERPLPESLIRTKLHRPRVPPNHVHRSILFTKMNSERQKPLMLVSAPAGYGKSFLVSCWLEHLGGSSAWLSLEKDDDDPHRFLTYFLAAVASIFPDAVPRTTSMLHAFDMPPIKDLSISLINELDRTQEDFVLVLDDLHHLRHRSIFELLGSLLQHPPAHMHLVLISRRDPFLPIAALRAQSQIVEIRTNDLRFTPQETALFLEQALEAKVDSSLAASWAEKTEGWCSGLRLAALAMRRRGDSRIPKDLPDSIQYVLEYLFHEVFSHQSEEIQTWLLSTAILGRFCAPLCEAVVGTKKAQKHRALDGWQFISFLKDENLFLVDLDTEKRWFRYHQLFQRLLNNQLARRQQPERIAQLHQQASDWFAETGMIAEALQYALKAGNVEQAVRLVGQHRQHMYNAGRLNDVEAWLTLFPKDVTDRYAELLLAQSLVLYYQTRFQHIEPLLDRAETLIRNDPKGASLKGEIDLFRGFLLLNQGEGEASLVRIQNALDAIPTSHHAMIGHALVFLGLGGQMCGRIEQVVQLLSNRYGDPSTPYPCRIRALTTLVWIYLIAGDLDNADLHNRHQRTMALRRKALIYLSSSNYVQGMIHFHRHEPDAAIAHFTAALEHRYLMMRRLMIDCMAGLAMAYKVKGQTENAEAVVTEMVRYCHAVGDIAALKFATSCRLRLQLQSREVAGEALSHSVEESATSPGNIVWFLEEPAITRCRALMSNGSKADLSEAERGLRSLLELSEAHHNRCQAIHILPLLALNVHRQGRPDESLKILEKALRLAEPGGWVQPFVEIGPPMAELLAQIRTRGVSIAYIENLLTAIGEPDSASQDAGFQATPQPPQTQQPLIGRLTNRERDILELLARRWQNKEIADKLCVSPETVKSHLKNIYQKLDAPDRIKAVEKARQLGLLPERKT
ncbi:MAG: response regulator [Desulfobacterales bacterium]